MLKFLNPKLSHIFFPKVVLTFVLGALLLFLPQMALADGGGPQPTPIPTSTPTFVEQINVDPGVQQPTEVAPFPPTDSQETGQIQTTPLAPGETYPIEETTGSGLPLGPLALLFLALLAFGAIAFLLFRKK